ncbi:AAA family ATPase [Actinomyces provencensis]|uniref:AAA family ATPase n=1 Tax=Actinomyces provencensis TaxID=1720198 RepID=UPI00389919B3
MSFSGLPGDRRARAGPATGPGTGRAAALPRHDGPRRPHHHRHALAGRFHRPARPPPSGDPPRSPPGTGKTYLARAVARHLAPGSTTIVQFHPSHSHKDVFEGFRPTPLEDRALESGVEGVGVAKQVGDETVDRILDVGSAFAGGLASRLERARAKRSAAQPDDLE